MSKTIIHIHVFCVGCNFSTKSSFPYIKKVRREAIAHSKKTGHEVYVETGTSTRYINGEGK